jgi:hypothetical protein
MSQNLRVATFVPIADPAAIGNLIKTTAGPTANRRLASAFAADISGSGGGGGIEEAPIDSVAYARKNAGWVPEVGGGGGGTPGGATTQVQFNDAGAFAGSANLTFNKTSGVFTLAGPGWLVTPALGTMQQASGRHARRRDHPGAIQRCRRVRG